MVQIPKRLRPLEEYSLPPGRKFVAIFPWKWAIGENAEELVRNARKIGAKPASEPCAIYDAPATTTVDQMGNLNWTWTETEEKPEEAKLVLHFEIPKRKAKR